MMNFHSTAQPPSAPPSRPPYGKFDYRPTCVDMGFDRVDAILERERSTNKLDAWTKLDKVARLAILGAFAAKLGAAEGFSASEVDGLRAFLGEWLTKGRLKRAKDVVYSRDAQTISSIVGLRVERAPGGELAFSLAAADAKRATTTKSLTPKRLAAPDIALGAENRTGIETPRVAL